MKQKPKTKKSPLLYGFHAVREAWLNPDRDVQMLYITEQAQKGFESTLDKAQRLGLKRPSALIVDKKKLEKLLPHGAVHQGIAMAAASLEELDVQDFIIKAHGKDRAIFVLLDQVTDPHNVGAILRSASAFGLDGVVLQKKHAPALDGVLAKTACGAVDHIQVAHAINLTRAIQDFQEAGFAVLGLDERGDAVLSPFFARKQDNKRLVLVLGGEGEGIRRLIKENCDALLSLPTQGEIASLNVSNAAAVSFFAFCDD